MQAWAHVREKAAVVQAGGHFWALRHSILPTRQMGARKGRKGAFRVHHSTTFFFRRSHASETLLFALAILDSAPSGFRPLTFFRFKPFVFSSARDVLPPLTETLRFLERAQRSPASAGKPLFFSGERNVFLPPAFRSISFLDPLVFISFQGAAAAAAGRGSPPPPAGPAW